MSDKVSSENYFSLPQIIRIGLRSTVARNAFSLYLIQFANYVVPLIMIPYLVRVLEPAGYGAVAFAQGFINYLTLFVEYGFGWSATRKISVQRDNTEAINYIAIHVWAAKALLSFMGFFVLLLLAFFIPKLREVFWILLVLYGTILGNMLFPTWLFQGMERMVAISVINLVMKLAILVGVFVFVHRTEDTLVYAGLMGGGAVVVGLIGTVVGVRMFRFKFVKISWLDIWNVLKEGWQIFFSRVAIHLYTASRVFIVGLFTNYTIVGYYAVAEKMATAIQFLISPILTALYPRLSQVYSVNPSKSYAIVHKLQNITTVAYLILYLMAWPFVDIIVKFFAGQVYPEISISLKILLVSVVIINANAFRVHFLLISRRDEIFNKIHVLASIVGVILLIILTYLYSYIGAASSIVITEFIVLIMTMLYEKLLKQNL